MVFIPKKASSTRADGAEIFSPNSMRPLNLTNTDNRILCNAVRLHVEPKVAPGVSQEQRGFIRGRSMLANVIDIEEEMITSSLEHDCPLA
eukprot:7567419-Pyramimonas_sp.AAC.1